MQNKENITRDLAQRTGKTTDDAASATPTQAYPLPPFSDNAQLKEGSRASLLNWLDVSPDALVIVNQAGQITLVNGQVETLFGYQRAELVGHPLEMLLPERYHTVHVFHRERYTTSPRTRPMGAGLELYGLRKDGTEVPVDISLSPLLVDGELHILGAIRDVTERRRLREREHLARAEAEARLELLQLILDELPTSVYLVQGEKARLVLANRAATTVWGATWQVGQSMQDFLTTSHIRVFNTKGEVLPPTAFATLRALQQHEKVHEYQETIRRPDGTTLPVLVNAVALGRRLLTGVQAVTEGAERENHPPGSAEPVTLVVQQDVTEHMELERRKDEFIAMASHELKTPVTSIKTYVHVLHRQLTKQGDQHSAQILTRIDTQLDTLTRLIRELLDVTNMTIGILSWQEEIFDLNTLVQEIVEDLQRGTDRHQLRIQEAASVRVSADRERIGQVLTNLISNAIKYTPQGGLIVIRQTIDTDKVTLSIQDRGIGIPQEKQAQIFERFYRVRSLEHETFPGLGLGLYLSAEIVKRQGGEIWVESQPGEGSTFFFTIQINSTSEITKEARE